MTDLSLYGYIETQEIDPGLIPGRVTELHRDRCVVITEHGEISAVLKGSYVNAVEAREELPSVGDFVSVLYNGNGSSLVAGLLPRRSKFSRADFLGHKTGYVKTMYEQVVAANFDYVFILTSLNNDFNANRVLRYMTQAGNSGAQPVVVLTKRDLCGNTEIWVREINEAAPDVPVHTVSSRTGAGMEALSQYLQPGKTIVFLGMSGVGKSSLLNALMKEEVMAVKAIREDDSRGRHTTTHRQLFMLPCGAMVIDTPGMRELGLYKAEEGISSVFADIQELTESCRFSDCRHKSEPGCAVKAALSNGSLRRERWEQYLAQTRENSFVNDRIGYLREVKARRKGIAKAVKSIKKNKS